VGVRLFAALVPPARVLDHLERGLDDVRSGPAAALRWVPRENLHLTLAFYGDVPEGAVPDVIDGLTSLGERDTAPEIALSGAGAFSGRTLWVGVGGDVAGAQRLMAGARDVVVDHMEDGPPRPHLTVARSGRRARGLDEAVLAGAVRALSVYRGPSWRPTEIALLSSHLGDGPGGAPRYLLEATCPLG
jgi:2'-5' RNA ligase